MIVNHFKMKSNIVSYNLSGMGCSAGVIAISLAKELLQVIIYAPVICSHQKVLCLQLSSCHACRDPHFWLLYLNTSLCRIPFVQYAGLLMLCSAGR